MSFFGSKKKKTAADDPKRYLDPALVSAKIVTGGLKSVVVLPPGEDINEWLATNTLAFFNHVNMYYGTIAEVCTATSCPTMTLDGKKDISWQDDKGKKAKGLSAAQYIDFVTTYVQKQIADESVFPTKFGSQFSKEFINVVKRIFLLLFHVLGHIYTSHFHHVVALGEEAHLNTLFTHFMYFVREFQLIDEKDLAPLADLIKAHMTE
eukprot:Opistho-1_new@37725